MKSLFLALVAMSLSINCLGEHTDGGIRPEDRIRVLRTEEGTTLKELLPNGFRATFFGSGGEGYTGVSTLIDFTNANICRNSGRGSLIVGFVTGRLNPVHFEAKRLGFRVKENGVGSRTLFLDYDCRDVTLSRIQQLFFHPAVRYLVPDVQIGAITYPQ